MPSHFDHSLKKTARARELRRHPPTPEYCLWFHLRGAQLCGFSFRRQHAVGPYFLDFYCAAAKLAVELDGGQHGSDEAVAYDHERTRFLESKGIRVMRFPNHEVRENLSLVLDAIARALRRVSDG